jgi:hypothetical protein
MQSAGRSAMGDRPRHLAAPLSEGEEQSIDYSAYGF